jgi:hypothetical protein
VTDRASGHVFGKWGPRGPFRVYSWTQTAVTAFGLVVVSLLLVSGMAGPATILLAVLGGLGLRDGTGLPAWTRVGLGLRYLAWSRRRRFVATHQGTLTQSLVGIDVSECRLPIGTMGVVSDRGRFLAAMRVSPTRDPWLQSVDDREVAADDWARVVSSVPLETIDRIQIVTVARHGGGEALVADAERADGPGLEVLKEIASDLSIHVRSSDTVLVIRLSVEASREASRRGGIEAAGKLLYSTLQHLGSQFPPNQLTAEILAPADWQGLLSSVLHQPPRDPMGKIPVGEIEERWGRVRVDGAWHQVMWMWQWPQRPMNVGFLAPLLTGAADRVVSLVLEPADPESHQRSLDWAYRRAETSVATATGGKHRKQAELAALDTQLRELNAGHVPVRALITVSVIGPDPNTVDDRAGAVRAQAIAGSCRVAVATGRQLKALGAVLPLCRGLDKGIDW